MADGRDAKEVGINEGETGGLMEMMDSADEQVLPETQMEGSAESAGNKHEGVFAGTNTTEGRRQTDLRHWLQ